MDTYFLIYVFLFFLIFNQMVIIFKKVLLKISNHKKKSHFRTINFQRKWDFFLLLLPFLSGFRCFAPIMNISTKEVLAYFLNSFNKYLFSTYQMPGAVQN